MGSDNEQTTLSSEDKKGQDYQKMYLLCFNALTDLQQKLDECSIIIENAQKQAEGLFVEMGAPDVQNAHIRIAKK